MEEIYSLTVNGGDKPKANQVHGAFQKIHKEMENLGSEFLLVLTPDIDTELYWEDNPDVIYIKAATKESTDTFLWPEFKQKLLPYILTCYITTLQHLPRIRDIKSFENYLKEIHKHLARANSSRSISHTTSLNKIKIAKIIENFSKISILRNIKTDVYFFVSVP